MSSHKHKVAIIFGISGEQGQHVARGLINASYSKVFGVTHSIEDHFEDVKRSLKDSNIEITLDSNNDKGDAKQSVILLEANMSNPVELRNIFQVTQAQGSFFDIFLVTTTDFPPAESADASLHDCEEHEFQTIKTFFDIIKDFHAQQLIMNTDVHRHIVFSTQDNVHDLVVWLQEHETEDFLATMKPLDDGGIVPHLTGKGRGGEYAISLLHWMNKAGQIQTVFPGLSLTLITLPFLHSNFTACAVPLPTCYAPSGQVIQWSIEAPLGHPTNHQLDMMSVSDLKYIVPMIFQYNKQYHGINLRLSAEKITMDQVAFQFADLFGKDVIYSPLTLEEMVNELDIPCAQSFAQMCQYLSSSWGNRGSVELTKEIMKAAGREPQTLENWLLVHSDDSAFEKVGLCDDGKPIQCVAVLNAACLQGKSVIKGLLDDRRKEYRVRACICNGKQEPDVQELKSQYPDRITIHHISDDDVTAYTEALKGVEGIFAVSNLQYNQDMSNNEDTNREAQYARYVIDTCSTSNTVCHIVFSSLILIGVVEGKMHYDGGCVNFHDDESCADRQMLDGKARIAAYARSKHLSVTYIMMPLYSEECLKDTTREEYYLLDNGGGDTNKMLCMSIDELGPAVADIMDSYEMYAGHLVALLTDEISSKRVLDIAKEASVEMETAIVLDESSNQNTATDTLHKEPDDECWCVDTYVKDLGSMFSYVNRSQAVKHRESIAKTLQLIPNIPAFQQWLQYNKDNVEFRAMLGIR